MRHKPIIKTVSELGPLVIFFLLYKYYDMNIATIGVTIATVIATIVNFLVEKKISYVPLFTCFLLVVFGGFSIYSGDMRYIKMKPTVLYLFFFLILIVGVYFKKGFLKHIFGQSVQMSEEGWIKFSKRSAFFFLFIAVLNEFVWRNFSENLWVSFKVFGIITLSMIFLFYQLLMLGKPLKK